MLNMKSSNIYQNNFKKYGVDPRSLLWKTRGAAHQRFRQFWAEIDFNNKKVLDIGCGFGEFGHFLLKRYKNVDYTGIDIVPEFIENAKKLVPGGKFFVWDFVRGGEQRGDPKPGLPLVGGFGAAARQDPNSARVLPLDSPTAFPPASKLGAPSVVPPISRHPLDYGYDIVIASGVLNSNYGTKNLSYRKEAISKMFSLSNHIFAFNMLGGHPAPVGKKDSNVSYSDSLQILEYCLSLTPRVILRANYHPKDFTIVMYK